MIGSHSEVGSVLALTCSTLHGDESGGEWEGPGAATVTECIGSAMICIHRRVKEIMQSMREQTGRDLYVSPRHFLCLIDLFTATEKKFRAKLDADQTHTRRAWTSSSRHNRQLALYGRRLFASRRSCSTRTPRQTASWG